MDMSTTATTNCEGFRCEATATDSRIRVNGQTFHCCAEHADFFDAHTARTAGFSREFLAEMEAEAAAERALESRVS